MLLEDIATREHVQGHLCFARSINSWVTTYHGENQEGENSHASHIQVKIRDKKELNVLLVKKQPGNFVEVATAEAQQAQTTVSRKRLTEESQLS